MSRTALCRVPTIFWYWNSRTFQGPWSCIFKEQFSTKVYSMDSIKATCNICFCDYGTVLVDKNKTWRLLANLVLGKTPVQRSCWYRTAAQYDLVNSRTFKHLPVFKYFQGLEFRRKKFKYFQGLSRMRGNPVYMSLLMTTQYSTRRFW